MKFIDTPIKASLVSLVITELFIIFATILMQSEIRFEVLLIAGTAAFFIPLLISGGEVFYQKRVDTKNQELQYRTEELQNLNQSLTSQNRELDEFAQTVAHDLKTPLTAILGFADILAAQYDDLDPETITNSLQMVSSSARKALRIVDELLLLARVSQVGTITTGPLDMMAIVEEATHRLSNLASEYNATLKIPETWPVAVGQAGWVEEVWANYISNAIKYGGKSPFITLGSRVIKQPEGDIILFAVKDWGPGLSPEAQSQLFTPFTRLGQPRSTGYGLGLSIVQRIVTKLGGEVGVESKGIPGQGSVFYFTLPKYGK